MFPEVTVYRAKIHEHFKNTCYKIDLQSALSPTMCDAASESYVNIKYTLLCLGLYHLCFRSIKTNYRLSGLWSQISPLISVFFFFFFHEFRKSVLAI